MVVKNRLNARDNPLAAYALKTNRTTVDSSPYLSYPLHEEELAKYADGCVVIVVANEAATKKVINQRVWILGAGFANDSPTIESRCWGHAEYARFAAQSAFREAGIKSIDEIDFFEVDDSYAYKELQHLIALGLYDEPVEAGRAVESGETRRDGKTPVNVSGGALGMKCFSRLCATNESEGRQTISPPNVKDSTYSPAFATIISAAVYGSVFLLAMLCTHCSIS